MQSAAFILTLTVCLIFTPIARILAFKLNIVDYPNTNLKTHGKPTPYLGGMAIFISITVTIYTLDQLFNISFNSEYRGLILGALIILLLGLIDDIRAMTAYTKLSVQLFAAYVSWSHGIGFYQFDHWALNLAVTLIWVVAVTNAFNLIDIMDGLAAGVGGISSLFLALLLHFSGDSFNTVLLLSLAGACLGFLVYNFKPAKIYMGDTGSLLIGFLLACTVAQWTEGKQFGSNLVVPLFILGIPLFELIFVSVLRIQAGKSPLRGSKDHFALRLIIMGFSVKQAVLLAYMAAIVLGIMAMLIIFLHDFVFELVVGTLVLICLSAYKLSRVRVS